MNGRFEWIGTRWNQFWFSAGTSTDLGGARILFYAIVFIACVGRNLADWGSVPTAFWMPTLLFKLFHLPALGRSALLLVDLAWKLALALSIIGLWTRASTIVAAVLGFYWLGLPHNFGKVHHSDTLVALLLIVFAVARSGDACSIDRLRSLARARQQGVDADPPAGPEYLWPRRFALCLIVLAFFGAGLSKLRNSGLAWVISDNMRNTLLAHFYDHRPPTDLGLLIARYPLLTHCLAGGSLAMELGVITALCNARLRAFFITGLGFMQVGIWLMMGVLFLGYASIYPVVVPWSVVGSLLRRWVGGRGRVVMLFDGSCGICTRTMRVIRAIDILGRVEFLDVISQWAVVENRFPGLDRLRCLADMHVLTIGGNPTAGFEAYRRLAWRVPLWWPLLPFLYVPPVPQIGRLIYRRVADRRMTHGCELPWMAETGAGTP